MATHASFFMNTLKAESAEVGTPLSREHFLPDISQHLKSRRILRGERVEFLNGAGLRVLCECEDVPAQRYRVITTTLEMALSPRIELLLPLPKMDTLGEVIAQATEIGISKITFIKSEHAQIPKDLANPPIARAQRIADASCEQCSRAWRMEFSSNWASLEEEIHNSSSGQIVVADETLSSNSVMGFENSATLASTTLPSANYRLFIGPEGGWSEKERQLFGDAHVLKLGLGSLILRMPTAIVAAAFFLRLSKN